MLTSLLNIAAQLDFCLVTQGLQDCETREPISIVKDVSARLRRLLHRRRLGIRAFFYHPAHALRIFLRVRQYQETLCISPTGRPRMIHAVAFARAVTERGSPPARSRFRRRLLGRCRRDTAVRAATMLRGEHVNRYQGCAQDVVASFQTNFQ